MTQMSKVLMGNSPKRQFVCVHSIETYPMSQNTSPTPPDVTPLPPVMKAMALTFSVFMTLALLAFIGFITVEFVADLTGHPLFFARPGPVEKESSLIETNTEVVPKSPFELITPKHQTQIGGPEVVVIYTVREGSTTLPELRINDVQHRWQMQFGGNTWFSKIHLPEGLHHLQVGEAEAEFFVSTPDATEHLAVPWLRHIPHPDTDQIDRCVDCHEMPPSQDRVLGAWRGTSSCFVCHDENVHSISHRFVQPMVEQPLRCVRCHTSH